MSDQKLNRTTTGSNAMADVVAGLLAERGFDVAPLEANGQLLVRFEDGSIASVQCQFYVPVSRPDPVPGLAPATFQQTITSLGLT